jgi:branched-chain amino acid transport system ATP-binding protein
MLSLEGLNVHYGKIHVLRDVALRVDAGEVVGLVGPNAAGKTTTLRTVIGLKSRTSGTIRLADQPIEGLSTPERVRLGAVLVPEGRQVFTRYTVRENLVMGAYHRADRNRIEPDIEEIYSLFPRLSERRSQRAGLMSGGEQQMLAIGRGLMSKPRLLMLDEPTLGLAPIMVEEIERIVQALAARGMTILISEQNAAMALRVAHRAYVLSACARHPTPVHGRLTRYERTEAEGCVRNLSRQLRDAVARRKGARHRRSVEGIALPAGLHGDGRRLAGDLRPRALPSLRVRRHIIGAAIALASCAASHSSPCWSAKIEE